MFYLIVLDFVKVTVFHRQVGLPTMDADTKFQRASAVITTTTACTGEPLECKLAQKSN